jgi:preprotein translocase subunit Sec61beta
LIKFKGLFDNIFYAQEEGLLLSRREKRRRSEAPMPAASAGLLRFFEEETRGIKLRPEFVILMAVGLIAISLFAYYLPAK